MSNLNKILESLKITDFKLVGNKLISLSFINATLKENLKLGDFSCSGAIINAKFKTIEAKQLSILDFILTDAVLKNTRVISNSFRVGVDSKIDNCEITSYASEMQTQRLHNVIFSKCFKVAISAYSSEDRGNVSIYDTERVVISIRNNLDLDLKNVKELVITFKGHKNYSNKYIDHFKNKFTGSVDKILVHGIPDAETLEDSSVKDYFYDCIKDLKYNTIEVTNEEY